MHKSGLIELEAVVAVARRKSFRGAAAEIGMSTTSLSNAVAGLEARLGVRLFHRTTRSVSLTEAGTEFVASITPPLAEIRGAVEAVNTHRATPTGTLRINSSLGAAHRILTPVVLEYLRRYPQMSVDLVTEARQVDIVVSGFDAGIRLAEDVPRDMVSVPLQMPLRFAVVGTPDLFRGKKHPKKPADLASYACICVRQPNGAPYRWEFSRKGRKVSIEVNGTLTLDAPTLMREAALGGAGLAYLSEWSVAADIEDGRLVRVLEDWTPASGGLCLYYPGHRFVPAGLRAFVSVIREVTRTASQHG
jgi:DNA-binding transcriptional LysR family regulator